MSVTVANDDIAYVRLLIGDDCKIPTQRLYTDEQLAILIGRTTDCRLAAADALDQIASSEALLSKKITTQDLSTDGPAVAKSLREHAAALRRQVADASAASAGEWGMEITRGVGSTCVPEGTERPLSIW
ncbi:MAG: hypothetical protein HZY73_11295 [Micropruina sp.]|nr:MAG: hypothetical protein HZY73_11295 [Micropruina sp.]